MRRMIALRRQFKAFGRGSIEFLSQDNPKVLAFVRRCEEETILVLVNLSRFSQAVEINHPRFAGFAPEDLFSRNRFPVLKDSPYVILLGGHDYHLLLMRKEEAAVTVKEEVLVPEISVEDRWENVLEGKPLERLEQAILPDFLKKRRWFRGKGRTINRVSVTDSLPVASGEATVFLLFLEIAYAEGGTEIVLLPIHYAARESARQMLEESPQSVIARLRVGAQEGLLYDGVHSWGFREALFETIVRGKKIRMKGGELAGRRSRSFRRILAGKATPEFSQILKAEQTNTSILYDHSFFLKLYRRLEEGVNPEAEMGRFLTENVRFDGIAPLIGTLEYRRTAAEPVDIALLQGYIPSHGDAWGFALDEVTRYFDRVLSGMGEGRQAPPLAPSLLDLDFAAVPPLMQELIGGFFLEMVARLGKRTGELHLVLASRPQEPAFSPEPFSLLYQRSVYQSMRSLARQVLVRLERNLPRLAPETRAEAQWLLASEQVILQRLRRFLDRKFSAMKIRIHGDYHLGQVLYTGKDFAVIDFDAGRASTVSPPPSRQRNIHSGKESGASSIPSALASRSLTVSLPAIQRRRACSAAARSSSRGSR
jgi:maltose alpha-D-glucosyltransferase/alpha-amylase